MLTEQEAEEFRIRQLVEKWALTRDAGDWAGFASVWHCGRLDDGHLVSGAGRRFHPGQPGRVRRRA